METVKGLKWRLHYAIVIALLSVTAICFVPVVSCMRMPLPEVVVKRFKIGSTISELDHILGDWNPPTKDVDVSESGTGSGGASGTEKVKTRIGSFRRNFTGTIILYHYSWVIPDDIRPSFMIELAYSDGYLTSIDYGILPG